MSSQYFMVCQNIGYTGKYKVYGQNHNTEPNETEDYKVAPLECGYGKSKKEALDDLTKYINNKMKNGFQIYAGVFFKPSYMQKLTEVSIEEYTPWYVSVLNFLVKPYNSNASIYDYRTGI